MPNWGATQWAGFSWGVVVTPPTPGPPPPPAPPPTPGPSPPPPTPPPPAPAPAPVAEFAVMIGHLIAAFEPWMTTDLQAYLDAIGSMFSVAEAFYEDSDAGEGWTVLYDPDRAPVAALGHLGQYVGERLPVGLSEARAREWIKDAPNQRRGTPQSIFYAAQRSLTGQRQVTVRERDGTVDTLTVITYVAQTPNPAVVLADLLDVVPADVVLNYETNSGQDWQSVSNNHTTWSAVQTAYPTWAAVTAEMTGAATFSRTAP